MAHKSTHKRLEWTRDEWGGLYCTEFKLEIHVHTRDGAKYFKLSHCGFYLRTYRTELGAKQAGAHIASEGK